MMRSKGRSDKELRLLQVQVKLGPTMSIIGNAGTDYLYPRRDELRPILETALDAVVVMKSDGIVADWNDRAAAVFGWSREEAVGRVMADLVIPERYREAHRKGLRRYLESGKGEVVGRRIEVSGLRKNGEEFLVELSISPIQDRENILFIGFLRDITELQALRLARAELGRAMRRMAMGEMAASIAHEIKQPLAAISANGNAGLRWLTRATPDIERACDVLKRIVSDTQHASEVIDGIRSMFKNEGQAKTMQDVNELIREALTLVRTEVENQHVSICTELSVELPQVPANQIQLRQVMVNLITNAVDAMSAVTNRARVLRIKTEEHKLDGVLITVEDSGVGIEPQNLDRIFDTFFTTKSQGMGMGLSICRSIVESHEGHPSVAAAQPHGSIFHVSLPTGTIRPEVKPEL
jgi:PAS domain S-box-containing protein